MPHRLIVPIDVQALCVNGKLRQDDPRRSGFDTPPLTRFENLPFHGGVQAPFLGEKVVQDPFHADENVEQGVHVHWAMPDALMHAERSNGVLRFPVLPDRWLVTRFSPDGTALRSWMVDSRYVSRDMDAAQGNADSPAVPWTNENDSRIREQPYRFLGRSVPLEDWTEPPVDREAYPSLTAVGLGPIQAAAYYPSSRNVFGLYDAIDWDEKKAIEFCYSVVGWHSRCEDDPIHGLSGDGLDRRLDEYNWSLKDQPAPRDLDGTIYCGMVHSVKWDPDREPAGPSPEGIKVAVGNNTTEALAALLRSQSSLPNDEFEWTAHVLLSGQLDLVKQEGGRRQINRQLHRQRFAPISGAGLSYARRIADGADVTADICGAAKEPVSAHIAPKLRLSAKLRERFDVLNALEVRAAELRNLAGSGQVQAFADWCHYLEAQYPKMDDPPPIDVDAVMEFMCGRPKYNGLDLASLGCDAGALQAGIEPKPGTLHALDKAIADYQKAKEQADSLRGELDGAIAAALRESSDRTVEVAVRPAADYWRPADPVLLLSGPDVQPPSRYGMDNEAGGGVLECRTSDAFVSALNGTGWSVDCHAAPVLDCLPDSGIAGIARSALCEAALLWHWVKQKTGHTPSGEEMKHAVSKGVLPSPVGINAGGGDPWLPILMHWGIEYRPLESIPLEPIPLEPSGDEPTLSPQVVLRGLAADTGWLDPYASDLRWQGAPAGDLCTQEGIQSITPQAGLTLWKRLTEYAAAQEQHPPDPGTPEDAIVKLAKTVTKMPLLSQALTGFHDGLLQRKRTAQLKTVDPFAAPDQLCFDKWLWELLKGIDPAEPANTTAPIVLQPFCPVRGGTISLETLRLVDVFGRWREYSFGPGTKNTVVAAQALKRGAGADLFLPPRLAQAARIRFDWLSPADDAVIKPHSGQSPIFGWIVPNYLDLSLMIFDASGEPLGSLAVDGAVVSWLAPPGNPERKAQMPEDRNLGGFVSSLLHRDGEFLKQYLSTLNEASNSIHPSQPAQLPVLVGQTLALVRASVSLELMGAPAANVAWHAFKRDVGRGDGSRTTNGHESVRFPVLLGSVEDPDDGLLGFYVDSGSETYASFIALAGVSDAQRRIRPRRIDSITVSPKDGPVLLTLVMDPRSEIHVTTGYMPAVSARIDTEVFRDAFGRLRVTFLTAPLLTATPPPATEKDGIAIPLPLPGQQKGKWNWVRVLSSGQVILAQAEPSKPAAPLSNEAVYLQDGWLSLTDFSR